jgi:hypothetical protein
MHAAVGLVGDPVPKIMVASTMLALQAVSSNLVARIAGGDRDVWCVACTHTALAHVVACPVSSTCFCESVFVLVSISPRSGLGRE